MTTILFHGNPVRVCDGLPAIGTKAPDFSLANCELSDATLATFAGQKKVLLIVPSLDTPVCASSARKFNQKAAGLTHAVVLIVSADLPFAQCRFCDSEGLGNVTALSTFRSNFAEDYGVKLLDTLLAGLMASAVLILSEDDTVVYSQLVAELTEEPDYESVWAALQN